MREGREGFSGWLEDTIRDVMRLFVEKWRRRWAEKVTEVTAKYEGFADWYLDGILRDTAGVTGLELCRRIVGIAHVKDITSIEEPAARVRAERLCITAAKRFILERGRFRTGDEYLAAVKEAAARFPRPEEVR